MSNLTINGYAKYVPYVCLADYALARSVGFGMIRTQTISNGAPKCDFRFRKDFITPSGFPPDSLEEFKATE
ncbi:MAG: L-2-amino-thiazoline-4-carboxylic acid hydrolase [Candidatus Thorarchaeota archaeon]|nr:L-2-amino-thiazoline-4-carboxylic acid hydrolase [Candidatus Thorarchaeota archaeon]